MARIQSPEEFRENLELGDKFWEIHFSCGRPEGVTTGRTILEMDASSPKIRIWVEPNPPEGEVKQINLGDLFTKPPGVFTTEEAADSFLEGAQKVFDADPERRQEYEEGKAYLRRQGQEILDWFVAHI